MSDDGASEGWAAAGWLGNGQSWPIGLLRPEAPPWAVYGIALARNLAGLMAERGWSVVQLAERARVGADDIESVLAGSRRVSTQVIAEIEVASGRRICPTVDDLDRARRS